MMDSSKEVKHDHPERRLKFIETMKKAVVWFCKSVHLNALLDCFHGRSSSDSSSSSQDNDILSELGPNLSSYMEIPCYGSTAWKPPAVPSKTISELVRRAPPNRHLEPDTTRRRISSADTAILPHLIQPKETLASMEQDPEPKRMPKIIDT